MNFFLLCVSTLFVYILIEIKLIITNHWTTGKKLLVALVGSIIWLYSFIACHYIKFGTAISVSSLSIFSIPLVITGIIMAIAVYRKSLE